MKIKLFLFVFLITLNTISCKKSKKEEVSTGPYVEINFGYSKQTSPNLTPFQNQVTLPLDSLKSLGYIGITIAELNQSKSFQEKSDSIDMQLDAQTKNDLEHFESGWIQVETTFSTTISARFTLPCKISSVAIQGNDTLELTPTGEFIKINYVSSFSSLKGSKTLNLTP